MTRKAVLFLIPVALVLWPTASRAQGSTIQAFAIGDSITWWNQTFGGYGPKFEKKFEMRGLGKASWRSLAGSNPCTAPWAQWVSDFPKPRLDFLVIQDDYQPGACVSEDEWRLRWQELVDVAKSKGAFVIVLAGTHPDLSSVNGIDVRDYPVPEPDGGDGVHYTSGGYKLYAKNVVNLLDFLIHS